MSTGIHFTLVLLTASLTLFSPRVSPGPLSALAPPALCTVARCHRDVPDPFYWKRIASPGKGWHAVCQLYTERGLGRFQRAACHRQRAALPHWWHIASGKLLQHFTACAIRKSDRYFCVASFSLCRQLPLTADRL